MNFLKTGAKTLDLIELSKLMFHEGKDRRYKGTESVSISLISLNLKNSRKPKKSPLLLADILSWSHLEAIGTVISLDQDQQCRKARGEL